MGTHQLPPRHALLPSLQSPTADNHYAAAHDIQKIFEKICGGTFIAIALKLSSRQNITGPPNKEK